MDFLKEWITNIILFVLLATVIDMLLPNSSLQKYTKMVTGLLLIAIILAPILKLVSNEFEIPNFQMIETKNAENLLEIKKKEIQASQHAYILEQTAVQMKKDAEEELMAAYGLMITNIDFSVDEQKDLIFPENLQKITVQLKPLNEEVGAVEVVKKVEINTNQPPPPKENTGSSEKIASLLSEKWGVGEKIIEVLVEGGNP